MKCNTCKNTVSDHMVYCPFCGNNLQTGAKSQDSRAVERELIDKWEKEENYSSVLQSALKGNSYAKYIYLSHVKAWTKRPDAPTEYKKTYQKVLKLAEAREPFAMTVHGILLAFIWSEKGILQNLQGRFSSDSDKVDKGMVYLQDAAQLNECAAEYELAYRTIKNFDRVKLNEIKTFHYLEHSAGQEYPPALYLLGTLYQKGENGVLKDEEKAFSLLEKAAFWGVPLAQKAFVKEDADWKKEILQPGNEADIVEKAKIFCSCNTYNKDSNGILNVYRGISYADEAQANCCMQEEFAVSKMIQKCNTLETLIDTKQELIERKNSFTVYRVEDAIKKLNEKITSFSNGKQTSDAEILKYVKDKEKAKSIILGFKSPKHFSAYKKTLAEQGISNDIIVEMKTFIEERMRKVFSKELEDYQYYLKLKKNTSSSLTAYLGVIVWFVIGYFATGAWGTPGMIAWVVAVFIFFDTFITRRKVGRRKRGWKIINDFLNQGFALIKK